VADAKRVRSLLLAAIALLLLYAVLGDKPWDPELAERVASGKPLRAKDYAASFEWWACVVNAALAAALLATRSRWLETHAAPPLEALAPPARPSGAALGLVLAAVIALGAAAWPRLQHGLWDDEQTTARIAVAGYYEADGQGTHRRNVNPWINLRPSSAISLAAGLRYEINKDDAQWVENVENDGGSTHYVFGRIDQKTVAMTLRFNYTMTPNLSLQTYAEPFVSSGDYTKFRELVNGRAEKYPDRYQPYDYTGSADFNIRSFRTTNVLRWEYKPGSQLFLVWQQGRYEKVNDYGTFQFNRDFGGLFSSASRNVFLVKFTYWVNM